MKKMLFLIIIFIINVDSFGQENISFTQTGNLSFDAKQVLESYKESNLPQIVLQNENKKSPFLAGILSLLVPGTGEIYSEEYLKAGIFIALEAAVITTAVIYDGKGDDKTTEFQNYADAYNNPNHNWSVVKYAQWLVQYEHNNDQDLLNRIIISSDETLPPWQRVNWTELNAAEKGSHKLPRHGEQQYYELIGKYHQYSSGWNDFTGGGNKDQLSPNFLFYSGMRGEANDFYSVASTAVIGIYVNHFLSALDAVWSASQFNSDLAVKVRLDNIQLTDRAIFYPKVILTYSF
jgi:hypothetical protein